MDVPSEVPRVIRLSGAVHFLAKFTQPWAFLSSSPDMDRKGRLFAPVAFRKEIPQRAI